MTTRPVVVAVAITGSVPRKKDNPNLPVLPSEQIASTRAAFEAGASLVHIHVRHDDETPSSDPDRFAQVQAGIREVCPGMIIQFSTGGRGRDPAARGLSLVHRPDMASLSTGSVNFPTIVYENPTSLVNDLAARMREHRIAPEIEIFDLSHIHAARRLIDEGMIGPSPHIQFVMGVKNAMPADEVLLDVLLAETRRVIPGATWTAAGIGREQMRVMEWALVRGADAIRTGMEDNIRVNRDRLTTGNAELVGLAVEVIGRHGCRPATPAEARAILNLTPV
ncbi:3-keto-5-aminohexanoate cleavage protein [Microvirga yunnanensis]|uniref:3-keto-5-aminohexanoate cleavage protein n=1 Tax=Microvirga yunnanensis TaxID=2953740 RepID=UPI0021C95AAC|nr:MULTISPECIES: 3-keto-5-aminohexanoate cleavage protein [unclassified Microvirga]